MCGVDTRTRALHALHALTLRTHTRDERFAGSCSKRRGGQAQKRQGVLCSPRLGGQGTGLALQLGEEQRVKEARQAGLEAGVRPADAALRVRHGLPHRRQAGKASTG